MSHREKSQERKNILRGHLLTSFPHAESKNSSQHNQSKKAHRNGYVTPSPTTSKNPVYLHITLHSNVSSAQD